MKNLTRLCFLFCLMILPFTTSAYASKTNVPKAFKLKEFAGKWVLKSYSIGGVGVNTGGGYSSSVLRIIDFDKLGQGKALDTTVLVYRPDGTFVVEEDANSEIITMSLQDSINGAGTISVQQSGGGPFNVAYKFIALRNKKGKVNKLDLILADTAGVPIVDIGVLTRQQPQ